MGDCDEVRKSQESKDRQDNGDQMRPPPVPPASSLLSMALDSRLF